MDATTVSPALRFDRPRDVGQMSTQASRAAPAGTVGPGMAEESIEIEDFGVVENATGMRRGRFRRRGWSRGVLEIKQASVVPRLQSGMYNAVSIHL
jgi:hypothetical protein